MKNVITFSEYTSVDLDVDADIVAKELERAGYKVYAPDAGAPAPLANQIYDAYTRGDVARLDNLLRDYFDQQLGRVAGRSPLLQREAA
jgi:hypothetical protein